MLTPPRRCSPNGARRSEEMAVTRGEAALALIETRDRLNYRFLASLILALCLSFGAVGASGGAPDSRTGAQVQLADVQTLDQDERSLNFARDAIGDHIVVVNFIYTRCKTVCPISSALFAQLQELLRGKKLTETPRLVSITLDPLYDTPSRLKSFAEQYDAGNQWLWITGGQDNIAAVTRGLGASTDNFRDHDSLIIVGDPRTSNWTAFNTLPEPEILLAEIERLVSLRSRSTTGPGAR